MTSEVTIRAARLSDAEAIAGLATAGPRCSRSRRRSRVVSSTEAHKFYEHVGYRNIKTQLAFAKPLDASAQAALRGFIPDVAPADQ
jgi:hypothetical protein